MKYATCILAALVCAACCETEDQAEFRSLRLAVVDAEADAVGWLVSPSAESIVDHDDIFSAASPTKVQVTLDGLEADGEYGFWLTPTGPVYGQAAPGGVLFTRPGCTGTAHQRIASTLGGGPIAAAHCTDEQIDALSMQGQVVMHYPAEAQLNTQWPWGAGLIVVTALDDYLLLPRDQPWPQMLTAVSMKPADNTDCVAIQPTPACAVQVIDTNWAPPAMPPPFSLVETEDLP
jgi:hypothetical protein